MNHKQKRQLAARHANLNEDLFTSAWWMRRKAQIARRVHLQEVRAKYWARLRRETAEAESGTRG